MIFAIPAIAAAVLLLSACNRKKSDPEGMGSDKVPPHRPNDPEASILLARIAPDTYWHDLDLDGAPTRDETVFVPAGGDRESEARKFIEKNRSRFSPCFKFRPQFAESPPDMSHPEKDRVLQQLEKDIRQLKGLEGRPLPYARLLKDLEIMAEELPFVSFRYPETGEVPPGFIGSYDPLANEMVVNPGAPVSLLIHEMDHQLTAYRRVSPWSLPYKVMCEPGDLRVVPKVPELPAPTPEKTEFKFSLDYLGTGRNHFIYKDLEAWKPVYQSLELGAEVCLTDEAKSTALANEVRGYTTMARYLLFRIGFTERDIQTLREGNTGERNAAEDRLSRGLDRHLKGGNLNPHWAKEMVMHYLARGGSSDDNLEIFVNRYYTKMRAPGFVDGPDCQAAPR